MYRSCPFLQYRKAVEYEDRDHLLRTVKLQAPGRRSDGRAFRALRRGPGAGRVNCRRGRRLRGRFRRRADLQQERDGPLSRLRRDPAGNRHEAGESIASAMARPTIIGFERPSVRYCPTSFDIDLRDCLISLMISAEVLSPGSSLSAQGLPG